MKIVAKNPDNDLGEIEQTIDVKFSFAHYDPVKDVATRLHEWCKCRDFLGDVVIANYADIPINVYGFRASKERIPLDKEHGYLLISFPSKEVKETFIKNLTAHSPDVTIIGRSRNTLLIKFWEGYQEYVWLISLFTFLLKCYCYNYDDVNNFVDELISKYPHSVEASYISNNPKKFKWMLDNIGYIQCKSTTGWENEATMSAHTLHNACGFKTVMMNSHFNKENNEVSAWVEENCNVN